MNNRYMAPRLSHKKSRKGCVRCKARRVKCDETHPRCINCKRHGVACEYGDPALSGNREPQEKPTQSGGGGGSQDSDSAQSPIGLPSPYSDPGEIESFFEPEERRDLELRLLHHFITVVTYTFPACDEQRFRDLWNIDTVRNGFKHRFLLNAILAISALHLLSDSRSMTLFYARDVNQLAVEKVTRKSSITDVAISTDLASAHRIYLNLAIRQQREAVSNLNPFNADAIFMASLLLSYQYLRLIPTDSSLLYSRLYEPPIQWLKMAKAVASITTAAAPLINKDSTINLMLSWSEPDFRDPMVTFDPIFREPFQILLDWGKYPEPDLNLEIQTAYEMTLAYVGSVYHALKNKESPRVLLRRIVCLGVVSPVLYIKLLEEKRPRALVILAHHLAMAKAVEEHWWVHGVAERVVNGIQSILPAEWQWAMEWPLSMIKTSSSKPFDQSIILQDQ